MNKRCCNCFSSSKIKSATNTPKITNMTETRFRDCRYVVRHRQWSDIDRVESKMTPRLRAVEVGVIEMFEGIARIGLDSLDKNDNNTPLPACRHMSACYRQQCSGIYTQDNFL